MKTFLFRGCATLMATLFAVSLAWAQSGDARRIRLRRENSKNEEPRVIVLTGDLLRLVQRRWAARQIREMRETGHPA